LPIQVENLPWPALKVIECFGPARSLGEPPRAGERKLSSTGFRSMVLGLATRTLLKVFATIGTLVMTTIRAEAR